MSNAEPKPERLPPHIGQEQLARIRHALHHLPQVVKPADFIDEGTAGFESHLDKLGYVLLQKSVPGARPMPRSIRPGCSASSIPNCSATTSG